jgi:trans-aconitate methyltransferase
MRLRQMFDAEGTDKGPLYADAYEVVLRVRRKQIRRVLEIGIGTMNPRARSSMFGFGAAHYRPGASLRAWRDYFPNAQIIGLDVQPDTQFTEERIQTFICDTTDAAAVEQFLSSQETFDLIIDDGSHDPADQLATLKNFFPALKPSGIYAIEDIHWQSSLFNRPNRVEPFIDGAPYCVVYTMDDGGPLKLVVITRPS